MAASNTNQSPNFIWSYFSSVRLTILLLIILAIASIAGTVIPQQQGVEEFAKRINPGLFRLFDFFQLFDMYHSIWFRVIIGLLALNLIICTIDRFPGTWKLFKASPKPDRLKPFENLPSERHFKFKGSLEDCSGTVNDLLKRHYKRVEGKKTDQGHFFYGEKGRFSYFGVYFVHLSVLLILLGGMVGSYFGLEAFVNIPEGDYIEAVRLRNTGAIKKIDFRVRCDTFNIDFYENGAPKEYRSELTFIEDGRDVLKKSLLVNHPVTFKGITFYQSSYGTLPGGEVTLDISKNGDGSEKSSVVVDAGRFVPMPGDGGQFQVADLRSDYMRLGPAALILVKPPKGEEIRFWVFQNHDLIQQKMPDLFERFDRLNPAAYKPYVFSLRQIANKYYTGLQVNRDPGVYLVWLGCIMMVVGFLLAFFTSHRRIWVRISQSKGKITVSTAGRSNKNPVGLERELNHLTEKLKNILNQ